LWRGLQQLIDFRMRAELSYVSIQFTVRSKVNTFWGTFGRLGLLPEVEAEFVDEMGTTALFQCHSCYSDEAAERNGKSRLVDGRIAKKNNCLADRHTKVGQTVSDRRIMGPP
jgi:hypothetical protein